MALKWSWIRLDKACRNPVSNKLNNTFHQADTRIDTLGDPQDKVIL